MMGMPRMTFIARFIGLCLIGFTMSIPFIWMVSMSFKPRAEVEEP